MFKKMVVVIAALALMSVGVGAAVAQEMTPQPQYPQNTITVSGFGTAFGEPDVAYIELGVELVQENLAEAYASSASTVNDVIAAVIAAGVDRADIQTTGVNIYPEDRYDQSGSVSSRVYRVRNTVRVTVRDIANVEQVIGDGVNAGANTIYNLTFGIADPSTLEQDARVQAVENARSRAEQLAGALGVSVGAPVTIVEVINAGSPILYDGRGGGGMMQAAVLQPVEGGQLSVGVQVQITFAIGG